MTSKSKKPGYKNKWWRTKPPNSGKFPMRKKSVIGSALILLTVTACATASPKSSGSEFCLVYQPVYRPKGEIVSETLQGRIDANNAVWLERCSAAATSR